jgi:hypothetical protein
MTSLTIQMEKYDVLLTCQEISTVIYRRNRKGTRNCQVLYATNVIC